MSTLHGILRRTRSSVQTRPDANNEHVHPIPLPLPHSNQQPPSTPSAPTLRPKNSWFKVNRREDEEKLWNNTPLEKDGSSSFNPPAHTDHTQKHKSIQQLRRLVRKASTFSLRNRLHNEDAGGYEQQRRAELLLVQDSLDPDSVSVATPVHRVNKNTPTSTSSHTPLTAKRFRQRPFEGSQGSSPAPLTRLQGAFSGGRKSVRQKRQYLQTSHDSAPFPNMAAVRADPPISEARLKEVTAEACDTALASVTKYEHSRTSSWNTSIINNVLAALVKETSSSTSSDKITGQPQHKFVVNSTIIQHSKGVGDPAGKSSGRRGMHSASGAFWNNEKDGMWSYKYEAAEEKGMDIVIGVVWVWTG